MSLRAAASRRNCSLLHVACQPLQSKHSKRSTPHATLLNRIQASAASPILDDAFGKARIIRRHVCTDILDGLSKSD